MSTVTARFGRFTLAQRPPASQIAERIAAALALAPSLPVITLAAVAIRLLSRRSPFVAHQRVGLGGEPFWMLKLRTMWDGSRPAAPAGLVEYLAGTPVPVSKAGRDARITSAFAALCRRHSVDELPQLLNIAAGHMSFVGPRPLTSGELETYYADEAAEVLEVAPGMTGLWQVLGRDRLTYPQRRRLDLFYVRKRSLSLQLWIILRTPARVLSGRDAS